MRMVVIVHDVWADLGWVHVSGLLGANATETSAGTLSINPNEIRFVSFDEDERSVHLMYGGQQLKLAQANAYDESLGWVRTHVDCVEAVRRALFEALSGHRRTWIDSVKAYALPAPGEACEETPEAG